VYEEDAQVRRGGVLSFRFALAKVGAGVVSRHDFVFGFVLCAVLVSVMYFFFFCEEDAQVRHTEADRARCGLGLKLFFQWCGVRSK
jgi:hypothetical protein